jgi:predicted nucleic acid-binding protein
VTGGFLLDTNIPSELMRSRPEPKVEAWLAARRVEALFLSVVSIGELESGFTVMSDAERRTRLQGMLEGHLVRLFQGRILPVTQFVAARWGRLNGVRQSMGRPLNTADGMIAATALEHGLTLVTRNTKDFDELGVTLINPWLES